MLSAPSANLANTVGTEKWELNGRGASVPQVTQMPCELEKEKALPDPAGGGGMGGGGQAQPCEEVGAGGLSRDPAKPGGPRIQRGYVIDSGATR